MCLNLKRNMIFAINLLVTFVVVYLYCKCPVFIVSFFKFLCSLFVIVANGRQLLSVMMLIYRYLSTKSGWSKIKGVIVIHFCACISTHEYRKKPKHWRTRWLSCLFFAMSGHCLPPRHFQGAPLFNAIMRTEIRRPLNTMWSSVSPCSALNCKFWE